jgi:uncharacterized protein (TIGR02001 family)
LAVAGLVALLATAGAQAADCTGAVGLNSENVYRGIPQSEGQVSAFGDLNCRFARDWVGGIGASTLRTPARGADVQFGIYLDRHWRFGEDWAGKLGIIHFEPLHAESRVGYRYDEISAAIGFRGRWLTTLAWTPRVGNPYVGAAAGYNGWLRIETAWRQPLGEVFTLDAGIGYAHPSANPPQDYHYANLALGAAIGHAQFGLNRIWTSSRRFHYTGFNPPFEFTFPAEQRWLGSVLWVF